VPHAVKRDYELRDQGLVTVFLQSQQAEESSLPGFVWAHWPGFNARLANNVQLPLPKSQGIPHAIFLGVDGKVLWDGNPGGGEKQYRALLDQELVKVQKGWGPDPETRAVRAQLYGKQNLAEAKKAIDAIADSKVKADLQGELDAVRSRRAAGVKHMVEDDRWIEAREAALALQKSCTGVADWQADITALLATFDTPEAKKELAADDKLQKFAAGLRSGKTKANQSQLPAMLAPIAKSATGTKVGEKLAKLIDGIKSTAKD
jgi:hypothetical protein